MSVHNSNLKWEAKISVHSGFRRRKASIASPGYTGICRGLASDREKVKNMLQTSEPTP
jgi:hypothetical protein